MTSSRPPKAKVVLGAKLVDIPNKAGAKARSLHVQCGLLPVNVDDLQIPDVCICCGAEADCERAADVPDVARFREYLRYVRGQEGWETGELGEPGTH